jgi:hypothetical protein
LIFTNIPKYWCSRCDVVTQFSLRVKEPAEFTFAVRKAMDAASGPVKPYEVDYCDFLCRNCAQPVRVRYGEREFAMSSYIRFPLDVFAYELEALSDGAP